MLGAEIKALLAHPLVKAETSVISNTSPLEQRMKKMVSFNLSWFMQILLDLKNCMSTYNGLEVRVPFCNYRIVEYLYTVPRKIKSIKTAKKDFYIRQCAVCCQRMCYGTKKTHVLKLIALRI